LELRFLYQWYPSVFVPKARGSTSVDFLVFTGIVPTPVYIDGKIWHKGFKADEDKLVRMRLFQLMEGKIARPVAIDTLQLKDQASSDSQARKLFIGI